MHKVGWVADVINGEFGQPEMLHCPSSYAKVQKSIKDLSPTDAADADYLTMLFDKGYTTNYCQSWYMIHTGPNISSSVLDDEKVWVSVFGRMMRMDEGPLRTSTMLKVSPANVPLLGDGKFNPSGNEVLTLTALGKTLVMASNATDGPRFFYDENNVRTRRQYSRANPFLSQDYENFGGAHRRRTQRNREGHSFTRAGVLLADGHVEAFLDQFDGDESTKVPRADGQVDSWDLEGRVFDGVINLGRRSRSITDLE
jgi:prepilin-type processing-associated H-X9-DG protein